MENNNSLEFKYQLFNLLLERLNEYDKNILVLNVQQEVVASFPCVVMEMTDDYVHKGAMTFDKIENFTNYIVQFEIYTEGENKEFEADDIAWEIEKAMLEMNMRRFQRMTIKNFSDLSIYRVMTRYRNI